MTIVLTKLQHKSIEEKSSSKLQAFQRKIYLKAKQNPHYKFYCLYDKVFRLDTNYTESRMAKLISRRNKRRGIVWKLFPKGIYVETGLYKMINLNRKLA